MGAYNNTDNLAQALQTLNQYQTPSVEYLSHFPEIQYRYSQTEQGYQDLLRLTDENLHRREYPEASFCAVGAYATGLMGIKPDARTNTIETKPQLSQDTQWASLSNLTVLDTLIAIKHSSNQTSSFTNLGKQSVNWRCAFIGDHKAIKIHNELYPARHYFSDGNVKVSFTDIIVQPSQQVDATITI